MRTVKNPIPQQVGKGPALAAVYEALSNKPMTLVVIDFLRLWDEPDLDDESFVFISSFADRVHAGNKPMCLLCSFIWADQSVAPGGLAVVKAGDFLCEDVSAPKPAIISGVCQSCFDDGDVFDRCFSAYKKLLWPDLRSVHEPHREKQ